MSTGLPEYRPIFAAHGNRSKWRPTNDAPLGSRANWRSTNGAAHSSRAYSRSTSDASFGNRANWRSTSAVTHVNRANWTSTSVAIHGNRTNWIPTNSAALGSRTNWISTNRQPITKSLLETNLWYRAYWRSTNSYNAREPRGAREIATGHLETDREVAQATYPKMAVNPQSDLIQPSRRRKRRRISSKWQAKGNEDRNTFCHACKKNIKIKHRLWAAGGVWFFGKNINLVGKNVYWMVWQVYPH